MKHTLTIWPLAAALAVGASAGRSAWAQPRITPPTAATAVRRPPPPQPAPAPKLADRRVQPGAAVVTSEYRLGAGDKLRIEVYKDPYLSQSVQIRPDGKITLPIVGDIEASGQTPIELRDTVTTALKEYINNPIVTVIVVEAAAATAYIIGAVNNPGAVPLQGNLTVLQGLALAGGLNEWANEKNIRILRKTPDGEETITFNYKDAIRGNGSAVYLRPDDTVVVP
jgi:polysaccharide export outer membrane protein